MRDYELVMVISPEVADEAVPGTVERVQQFIQGQGGEIKRTDNWGRRRLAYPIRRYHEGYYVLTEFAVEPQAIRSLESNLTLAEDVIRHLVVKLED